MMMMMRMVCPQTRSKACSKVPQLQVPRLSVAAAPLKSASRRVFFFFLAPQITLSPPSVCPHGSPTRRSNVSNVCEAERPEAGGGPDVRRLRPLPLPHHPLGMGLCLPASPPHRSFCLRLLSVRTALPPGGWGAGHGSRQTMAQFSRRTRRPGPLLQQVGQQGSSSSSWVFLAPQITLSPPSVCPHRSPTRRVGGRAW